MRIAVVGATGAVGRELRRQLALRAVEVDEMVPVASARSAGSTVAFRGRDAVVRDLEEPDVFGGVDLALFSAGGSTSREHAPRAVAAGAVVVDNSSAWRMDPDVPLVVAEVNPEALASLPKGIVANPNCTTMQIMLPLQALHRAFGLTGFTATSFQAAGGAGQKGMEELTAQVGPLTEAGELLRTDGARAMTLVQPKVHAKALAYNVVPILGTEDEHGYTDEEYKLLHESRKILGLPELEVAPTCTRVPVMVGHCVQLAARFDDEPRVSEAISHLSSFPGLEVAHLPTPLDAAGRDEVLVGRIRADLFDPHVLHLWVVGDNLLKGAALNTVQLAELLIAQGAAG